MSHYVVDASVALKWVLIEPDSMRARDVLLHPVIAPHWWLVEAGNGLWKSVARKEMSADEADRALSRLRLAPVEAVPAEPMLPAALALANRFGHPIYDCLYLALAIERNIPLITADERFRRALKADPAMAGRIIMLKDFSPGA